MDLTDILSAVKEGNMDLKTAEQQACGLGFVSYAGIAKLDSHRKSRTRVIEAILADCKEPEDVVELARVIVFQSRRALITLVSPKHLEVLRLAFGEEELEWNSRDLTIVIHDEAPLQKNRWSCRDNQVGRYASCGRGSRYCLRNGLRNYCHI